MKRRRFIETSVGAGFAGAAYACSPSPFKRQEAGRANSQMDATETLARFISEFRYEDLSPQAVEAAKVGLIDGVGVMLAGATYQPLAALMADYVREMGGAPRCSVVGWGFQTNAPFAGLCQRRVRPLPGLRNTGLRRSYPRYLRLFTRGPGPGRRDPRFGQRHHPGVRAGDRGAVASAGRRRGDRRDGAWISSARSGGAHGGHRRRCQRVGVGHGADQDGPGHSRPPEAAA